MAHRFTPRPMYSYEVYETIQAAAADVSVANSEISTGNPLEFLLKYVELTTDSDSITAVTGTSQVTTLTVGAGVAVDLIYGVTIQWYDRTQQQTFQRPYYHVATATDTVTTVSDGIRDQINADPLVPIVVTGTVTIIMTADPANFPGVRSFISTLTSLGGGFTSVATTAGVQEQGTKVALVNEGLAAANFVDAAEYTRVRLTYYREAQANNTLKQNQYRIHDVFMNEGSANFAALAARWVEILNTFASGGAVVDPELLAVD